MTCAEGHVEKQQESGHLQTKDRGLRETNPDDILILEFQPAEV